MSKIRLIPKLYGLFGALPVLLTSAPSAGDYILKNEAECPLATGSYLFLGEHTDEPPPVWKVLQRKEELKHEGYYSCFNISTNLPEWTFHVLNMDHLPRKPRPSATWKTSFELPKDVTLPPSLMVLEKKVMGATFEYFPDRKDDKEDTPSWDKENRPLLDQGHLVPRSDFATPEILATNTFHVVNRAPQASYFNRNEWRCVETLVRLYFKHRSNKKGGKEGTYFVITGVTQQDTAKMARETHTKGDAIKFKVPIEFWKVLGFIPSLGRIDRIPYVAFSVKQSHKKQEELPKPLGELPLGHHGGARFKVLYEKGSTSVPDNDLSKIDFEDWVRGKSKSEFTKNDEKYKSGWNQLCSSYQVDCDGETRRAGLSTKPLTRNLTFFRECKNKCAFKDFTFTNKDFKELYDKESKDDETWQPVTNALIAATKSPPDLDPDSEVTLVRAKCAPEPVKK